MLDDKSGKPSAIPNTASQFQKERPGICHQNGAYLRGTSLAAYKLKAMTDRLLSATEMFS